MAKTAILYKDDFVNKASMGEGSTQLGWMDIMDSLGIKEDSDGRYPEEVEVMLVVREVYELTDLCEEESIGINMHA